MMNAELLDCAYRFQKASPQDAIRKLRERFPDTERAVLKDAVALARALINSACKWADGKHAANSQAEAHPDIDLPGQYPGFSADVYRDAEAWGLYLTK